MPEAPPQESEQDQSNRLRAGRATSVVAARRGNVTTFFAAHFGEAVYSSTDGRTWNRLGNDFPPGVGSIVLAVLPGNPDVVYALAADRNQNLHGLYRFLQGDGSWRRVDGVPQDLFGTDSTKTGQGWYDIAIAVAPDNVNRVYVGGAAVPINNTYSGALYRLEIDTGEDSRLHRVRC